MKHCILTLLIIMPLLKSFPAHGQGDDIDAALHKFSFCLVCHGYMGQGNTSVLAPPLAGIEPWYLSQALAAYRTGTRHTSAKAQEMQAAVRMVAAAEELEVAALFSHLPTVAGPSVEQTQAQLVRGEQAYRQYCAACHGASAEGNEVLAAPGLARLGDWYLFSAWQAYVEGNRGDSLAPASAQQMREFALLLPDDVDIHVVLAYITTLNQ